MKELKNGHIYLSGGQLFKIQVNVLTSKHDECIIDFVMKNKDIEEAKNETET